MEVVHINSLPKELLDTLLGLLAPRDLKSAVLVCKHWRNIGEGPHLWKWVKLLVETHRSYGRQSNQADMPNIIRLSRLAHVQTITMRVVSLTVMLAIEKHQGLKVMKIEACNVEGINSDLLARVVTGIEKVTLQYTKLNSMQWSAIFKYVSNGANLKKLLIRGTKSELFLADPLSLAKTIGTLEKVKLDQSGLTKEQIKSLFELLADESQKSKLNSLDIRDSDLSSVAAETMAKVISNLEEVIFENCRLNTEQSTAIFKRTSGTKSKMKVLSINEFRANANGLSNVDANIMAKAVNNVEKVYLNFHFNFMPEQCIAIFELAAATSSRLKVLDISYNDLSKVRPQVIAKVVANMEKINLHKTSLTNQQCNEIFKYLEGSSKLKVLLIGANDLSAVETDVVAKAVSKIEECELSLTELTTHQLEGIFELINEVCKIKKLDISGVNLSSVDVNVIPEAIANLEDVDLTDTYLTNQQLEAIFNVIRSRGKLKNLSLCEKDLRSVQIDSLVGALKGLKGLNLDLALLSDEQSDAINAIPEMPNFNGIPDNFINEANFILHW